MRFLTLCFVLFASANAESFLGNMFIDLNELNLTQAQHQALTNIMKDHHESLKEWYRKSRENNEKIIKKFSNSSLDKKSSDLGEGLELANERAKMEQDFLISVYSILNNAQRATLGKKIDNNIALKDNFRDSQNIEYIYIERQHFPLNGREFRRGESVNLNIFD